MRQKKTKRAVKAAQMASGLTAAGLTVFLSACGGTLSASGGQNGMISDSQKDSRAVSVPIPYEGQTEAENGTAKEDDGNGSEKRNEDRIEDGGEENVPKGKGENKVNKTSENISRKDYSYSPSGYGPGDLVPQEAVEVVGPEAFFYEEPISDPLFSRIYGKSFKEDCTILREDLHYIRVLYYDFDGNRRVGELISNKAVSGDLAEIFKELYENRYPIGRIRLVDDYEADDDKSSSDNNTSCFNFRKVPGKSSLSMHARGLAIDVNPRYNPYVILDSGDDVKECLPENGRDYIDRNREFSYKIDKQDLCWKLFMEHGFTWGGDWVHEPDYMHFSKSVPDGSLEVK